MTVYNNEPQNATSFDKERALRQKADKQLRLRNFLNIVFMMLAVVAMIGIGISMKQDEPSNWGYVVGIIAVLVKIAEAMLRMPSSLNKPRKSRFDRSGR